MTLIAGMDSEKCIFIFLRLEFLSLLKTYNCFHEDKKNFQLSYYDVSTVYFIDHSYCPEIKVI